MKRFRNRLSRRLVNRPRKLTGRRGAWSMLYSSSSFFFLPGGTHEVRGTLRQPAIRLATLMTVLNKLNVAQRRREGALCAGKRDKVSRSAAFFALGGESRRPEIIKINHLPCRWSDLLRIRSSTVNESEKYRCTPHCCG